MPSLNLTTHMVVHPILKSLKRERRLFYAYSLTALAVHVLARTTGLLNNNAVAYKPTIMIFMDMIRTHDSTWQPGNHVATVLPLQ